MVKCELMNIWNVYKLDQDCNNLLSYIIYPETKKIMEKENR